MRDQTSLISNRTFSDTREYFQNSFFPKLKPFGIPKAIARHYDEEENPRSDGLLPFEPTVETDTPGHYVVVKSTGNRMFVRVELQEDAKNVVLVTAECEAHFEKQRYYWRRRAKRINLRPLGVDLVTNAFVSTF